MLNLVAADDLGFLEGFESVELAVVLLFNEGHLAIGAFSNDRDGLEVVFSDISTG